MQNSSSKSTESRLSLPFPPPHSVKSYLVSLGPPQRKEAGEEELAPADDGSQAPVEASHACVRPVSSASLLSTPPSVPGIGSCNLPPTPRTMSSEKKTPQRQETLLSYSVEQK